MGYENAPATALVATHCACCARPLVDAASVEAGIGPDCRKRHGFASAQGEPDWAAAAAACPGLDGFDAWQKDARAVCNRLVWMVALGQSNASEVTGEDMIRATAAIGALGFSKLAGVLRERIATVDVAVEGDRLAVRTPYDDAVVAAMRGIAGRAWDRQRKLNTFPARERAAVWAVLQRFWPGCPGWGPKGPFVVPGELGSARKAA